MLTRRKHGAVQHSSRSFLVHGGGRFALDAHMKACAEHTNTAAAVQAPCQPAHTLHGRGQSARVPGQLLRHVGQHRAGQDSPRRRPQGSRQHHDQRRLVGLRYLRGRVL